MTPVDLGRAGDDDRAGADEYEAEDEPTVPAATRTIGGLRREGIRRRNHGPGDEVREQAEAAGEDE